MIRNIKFFVNNNEASIRLAKLVEEYFVKKGFVVDNDNFDLGIAIGGDGSFIRMVRGTNFDSNPYYVGINSGTLGFLQEANEHEVNRLINSIMSGEYKTENIGIEKTEIISRDRVDTIYSINEIIIRDKELKTAKLDVHVDDELLERFAGDGLLISSSIGSTGHNLSYGGSIVYSTLDTLQITPIAPINSKAYTNLVTSVILPGTSKVCIIPSEFNKDMLITLDGEHETYENVQEISTEIRKEKIKCLRFKDSNFSRRVNEKLLSK
ncbi:MAG: NAD(+)/NADH kinase [Bacilli bacterium]|nr:NAD(+)/NADH kinase [Bacilli bacterium]